MSELEEPWSTAAEKAGIKASFRGVAYAAGISHVTVRRLIVEGRSSPKTIAKVADALGVSEAKVYEWAEVPVSEWGPWTPPREAHNLNPRARAALEELIRAVTQGGNDAGNAEAEKTQPGVTPPTKLPSAREVADEKRRRMLADAQMMDEAAYDDDGELDES